MLTLLAAAVLWSGTVCALDHYAWSLWPWNRAWYMFAWNDGHLHHIEVTGELEDASKVTIDVARWFKYPVASDTLRTDQVTADYPTWCRLARYLARKHNAEAAPGRRVVRVTISDVSWKQEVSRRLRFEDVPASRKRAWKLVDRLECPAGEP